MAERFKAHAWRACVGKLTVGSNPTPSASQYSISEFLRVFASSSRSLSAKLAGSASAKATILYGFLKSKNNFCPLKRKFKPIFFRKSRPSSGFSRKARILLCLREFFFWCNAGNYVPSRPRWR